MMTLNINTKSLESIIFLIRLDINVKLEKIMGVKACRHLQYTKSLMLQGGRSSSAKDSRQVVWTVAKGTFDRAMFPRYLWLLKHFFSFLSIPCLTVNLYFQPWIILNWWLIYMILHMLNFGPFYLFTHFTLFVSMSR